MLSEQDKEMIRLQVRAPGLMDSRKCANWIGFAFGAGTLWGISISYLVVTFVL